MPYTKDGKVISWRAIFADLDEKGRRKRITWKSFPAKYKDEDGVTRTNSKSKVYQETVSHCAKLREGISDDLIDGEMTIMQFIEDYFQAHREVQVVNNYIPHLIRFLRENGWSNVLMSKISETWCLNFRDKIVDFNQADGKPYKDQNNIYARLVAELTALLKLAKRKKYVARNYNERLENPNQKHPKYISEKAVSEKASRTYRYKSWTEQQLKKYFPMLMSIPETIARKVDRANCKPRKANVRIDKGCYKTYWIDSDGKGWSKSFNIKKLGDKTAKKKAEALADEMTAVIAKEYEKGTASFYLREKRTFDDIDVVMVRAYFTLSLLLGLRNGEICGLKFSDFDKVNRVVDISKQLIVNQGEKKRKFDEDNMLEVNPKWDSFRVISYGDTVAKLLEELEAYHIMNEYTSDDYLLQYRYGGRVRPDYWTRHNKKFQTLAGIPESEQLKGTHSGRHTHLSILAQKGVLISELQKRAGHRDLETTNRYYIHIPNDNNARDAMEDAMPSSKDINVEIN